KILTPDQVAATGNITSTEKMEYARTEPVSLRKSTNGGTQRKWIVTMVVGLFLCSTLDFFLTKLFIALANSNFFRSLGETPFLPLLPSPASILMGCVLVLPIFFFGTKFGPWTGCVAALGVFLSDLASGYFAQFHMGTFWYWYVIFVFFGAFSGLA